MSRKELNPRRKRPTLSKERLQPKDPRNKADRCWLCGSRPANREATWVVKMSKATRDWSVFRSVYPFKQSQIIVPVPCCRQCRKKGRLASMTVLLFGALAAISGFTLMMLHPYAFDLLPGGITCFLSPASFLFLISLGFIMRWLIRKQAGIERSAWTYPQVREHYLDGWHVSLILN